MAPSRHDFERVNFQKLSQGALSRQGLHKGAPHRVSQSAPHRVPQSALKSGLRNPIAVGQNLQMNWGAQPQLG